MTARRDFNELRETTILSQYSASPRILELTEKFALRIDPAPDIDVFFENIFDIDTATGWGLDNWGRILGIPRGVGVASKDWFGFVGSQLMPLDQAPFYNDAQATNLYELSDIAYRRMLLYKAASNIGDASARSMNELLTRVFGDKFVMVKDDGDMHIRLTFTFWLDTFDMALLQTYGALNKGAGVSVDYYQTDTSESFGFRGSDYQPFGQGTFSPYGIAQG